jgi:IS5 family transposase
VLLLATWHLSGVGLAEALSGRPSFRRFCGFARDEATPECTAFVRFRPQKDSDRALVRQASAAIARDLESKCAEVPWQMCVDLTRPR